MKRKSLYLAACAGFALLLVAPSAIWAQVAPNLGVAQQFGALGAASVVGSAAPGTTVGGDVGSYPTPAISNFPPSSTVAPFTVHRAADGVVQQAQTDARNAYNFLAGQGGTTLPIPPAADQLSGRVLTSGIYALGAADLAGSTALTLNGPGIFIFNVASTLTMNTSSVVTGTANPCNVYWRVGTSATLSGSSFMGTVLANVSVTLGGGNVLGRVVALTGSVTMPTGGNTIGGCSAPPAVVCPTITLSPLTAPNGTVGVAYNQQISSSGAAAPVTFAVTTGALPAGLTLTPAGLISGTPTTVGTSTFTISGTDANGCSGTISYTVIIAAAVCPVITLAPGTLLSGTVGVASSQTITASGGTAPYSFGVTAGALPTGLTLTPGGVLSGTPTAAGTFTFTIRGTDANGCFASVAYTIVIAPIPPAVCPTITLTPATLPGGLVGVAYNQTVVASGGLAPYSFGVVSGTLPTGLTLSPGGVISGTPTVAVRSTVTIRATDANGCFVNLVYTIDIPDVIQPPGCPVITFSPATLSHPTVGVHYGQTFTGSGGLAPYTFSVTSGTLPAGLTLTAAGVISGTPTAAGTSTFTIRATDANGCFSERPFTLLTATAVPTLPQAFVLLLALGLTGIGYVRLRRRARG